MTTLHENRTKINTSGDFKQENPFMLAATHLAYRYGLPIFPLVPRGKEPLTEHGFKDATIITLTLRKAWRQRPDANVGIATGSTTAFKFPLSTNASPGVVVLDVDPRHGGDLGIDQLEAQYGPLPETVESQTGGGGRHLFFAHPGGHIPCSTSKIAPGVDVKADGGYVVAPPSIHPSGTVYEWELTHGPDDVPFATLPEWLHALLIAQPNGHHKPSEEGDSIHDGQRNDTLFKLACSMRARGCSQATILAALRAENDARCKPPLHENEVQKIANSGSKYAPGTSRHAAPTPKGFPLTDTGNSERLAHRYGDVMRWCELWKKWTYYDGTRWQIDNSNQAKRFAKETVRQIYAEASQVDDDERREKLAKFALQSESGKSRRELLELAKGELPILPDAFDVKPWLLNCQNGTVDLETGKLWPHCKDDYLTKIVPCEYDENASADEWENFLEKIFENNQELIDWLQRAMGYSLTGETREQIAFICHGGGSNGKSTLFETFRATLGDYGEHASTSTFLHTEREAIRNDLAKLRSARLVTAVETEQGKRLAESLFKSATGEDPITARFLFSENFTFLPQFKIWLATNHKPEIRGTDHAIWRRIRLIPFTVTISEEEQDKQLPGRLKAEMPGILAWLVRGCLRWQKEGLTPAPEIVLQATKEYREEMDVIASFLAEKTSALKGSTIPSTQLYEVYKAWTVANGNESETQMRFSLRLVERGIKKTRNTITGKVQWHDLTLRND